MPLRDVLGHRRIVALLGRSIARDSLPPSLIFAGPAGVGKRLTATALAQALNCLNPIVRSGEEDAEDTEGGKFSRKRRSTQDPLVDACGECASCRRIARGVHPDVLVVEPGDSGSIKIEQVRDVIDRSAYRPFEGRRRVVVVDRADALVPAAQNALLKTLEEPPSSSVFVLVTARPDALLPTVRSRCIRLWFAEGAGQQTDDGARDVARQVLAHAASAPDPRRRLEAAKDLLAGTGGKGAADRAQLAAHLRAMGSLLRDVEVLATGANEGLLANADVRPALDRLRATYGGDRGVRAFAAVDQALAALERNAGVKIVADWLVLTL
jgi:DNA polymerase-3 subunit delta'